MGDQIEQGKWVEKCQQLSSSVGKLVIQKVSEKQLQSS